MTHTPPARANKTDVGGDGGGGYANTSLWKYRPFSRVVRGYKTYKIVRNYIQLNEKKLGVKLNIGKKDSRGYQRQNGRYSGLRPFC